MSDAKSITSKAKTGSKKSGEHKNLAIKKPPMVFLDSQKELIHIQTILKCPVLSYYKPTGTSIWSKDLYAIWEVLKHIGKVDKLAVYIRSDGGSGLISLRIINLLRQYVKKLIVLAPSECASAATMLALGCDEIYLGPLSSLSAVDSSLIHPLSPTDREGNPVSVSQDELWRVLKLWREFEQGSNHDSNLETATNLQEPLTKKSQTEPDLKLGFNSKTRADQQTKAHSDEQTHQNKIISPYQYLYQYIHPLVFGAIDRSRSLSVKLCTEILEYHMTDPEKIKNISDQLNYSYPAHGYPITSKEAKKIGLNVKQIPDEVLDNLNNLQLLYGELTDDSITDYDNNSYHNHSVYTVVETTGRQIIYQNDYDKFYREKEKRYFTLNDLSGWHKITPTQMKKGRNLVDAFEVSRIFL